MGHNLIMLALYIWILLLIEAVLLVWKKAAQTGLHTKFHVSNHPRFRILEARSLGNGKCEDGQ